VGLYWLYVGVLSATGATSAAQPSGSPIQVVMDRPTTLVISRGDLPSLILLSMQPDAGKVIVWHPSEHTAAGQRRRACVEAAASARGVAGLIISPMQNLEIHRLDSGPAPAGRVDDDSITVDDRETRILHDAALVAKRLGCTRILSPWIVGPDHLRVSQALERAMLIVEIAEIAREKPELAIELPLLERTEVELAELAVDLAAPMHGFWPCEHGEADPCCQCACCTRWITALDDAGVEWPFQIERNVEMSQNVKIFGAGLF
jgi:hypothetical protein